METDPSDFKDRILNPQTGDLLNWDNQQKKWVTRINIG